MIPALLSALVQKFHSRRILRLVFFSFILGLAVLPAQGAHLVGGEISYLCLGDNNYQIKMRIYRDCASGGAQFDQNAAIAVYDSAGNLVEHLLVPKGPTVAVPSDSTGNPCVSAPPGLCTEYAEYIDTVSLSPIAGGYTIVHQRCCRNSSISNVINSGDFGNTYAVNIPPHDSLCNSSPQFNGVAPIVLCIDEAFNLPMKVSEPDGDSLHFELCDVFEGGGNAGGSGCDAIVPNPPCPPPFTPIVFAPPFNSSNPMPSSPALSIDPQTGVLSGQPLQLGQYLVGICVTEYRNGVPLSTVRLDYQFNTSNCILNVVSDMVTPIEDPEILCTGLEIQFESESKQATKLLWNFGDPSTLSDTSSSPSPTYLYSIPGTYVVTLIANPGLPCGDTSRVTFEVRNILKPEIHFDGVFCFEAQEVFFEAAGNYPSTTTYSWDFGPDANFPQVIGEEPPPITWSSPGKHYIQLTVSDRGCTETQLDSVIISNLAVGVNAGPDQKLKRGDRVFLAASGGIEYFWYASEPVEFANPWGQQTSAELLNNSDTVYFYVRVRDEQGCEGLDSLSVIIIDDLAPINFFTPDEDGINDFFDLSDLNPDGNHSLSILNRWGSEVYFEEQYDNQWTGLNKGGQALPEGTYYYLLILNGEVVWKDAITIMRSD